MERLLHIHNRLRSRNSAYERINATVLAKELEVTSKTIRRDVAYMRDRLSLPVEYVEDEYSFAYTREVGDFPLLKITEGELVALLVAKSALHQYRGTPFEKPLQAALGKIESGLTSDMSVDFEQLGRAISFRQPGTPVHNMRVFEALSDAVLRRRIVSFDYRKKNSVEFESRTVRPYHLTAFARDWYLVAHDEGRGALRTFRLAAMRAVKTVKGKTFAMPADFNPERYFGASFGIFVGEGAERVRIRFTGRSAETVADGMWHGSQTLEKEPGGSLVLTLHTGGIEELARWLLSFGDEAEVLEPAALREAVVAQCRRVLARCGG